MISRDFNDQRGDGWDSLIAYYSQQFKVTRFDLGLANCAPGRGSIGDYGESCPPLRIGNELTLGGMNYLNTFGGGVSMNWLVNETRQSRQASSFASATYNLRIIQPPRAKAAGNGSAMSSAPG